MSSVPECGCWSQGLKPGPSDPQPPSLPLTWAASLPPPSQESSKVRNWGFEEGEGRERQSPPAVCAFRQVTSRCLRLQLSQVQVGFSLHDLCPLQPKPSRTTSAPCTVPNTAGSQQIPLGNRQMETSLESPCPLLWSPPQPTRFKDGSRSCLGEESGAGVEGWRPDASTPLSPELKEGAWCLQVSLGPQSCLPCLQEGWAPQPGRAMLKLWERKTTGLRQERLCVPRGNARSPVQCLRATDRAPSKPAPSHSPHCPAASLGSQS